MHHYLNFKRLIIVQYGVVQRKCIYSNRKLYAKGHCACALCARNYKSRLNLKKSCHILFLTYFSPNLIFYYAVKYCYFSNSLIVHRLTAYRPLGGMTKIMRVSTALLSD